MTWVSSVRDGKMQLGACVMVFRKAEQWAKTNNGPPRGSPCFMPKIDLIMVNPLHMSAMLVLVVKRKVNAIKQLSKGDNVH
jgi:hypothetical protein